VQISLNAASLTILGSSHWFFAHVCAYVVVSVLVMVGLRQDYAWSCGVWDDWSLGAVHIFIEYFLENANLAATDATTRNAATNATENSGTVGLEVGVEAGVWV
jgi:hypothetical protein